MTKSASDVLKAMLGAYDAILPFGKGYTLGGWAYVFWISGVEVPEYIPTDSDYLLHFKGYI